MSTQDFQALVQFVNDTQNAHYLYEPGDDTVIDTVTGEKTSLTQFVDEFEKREIHF